jgi:hypothetical protein
VQLAYEVYHSPSSNAKVTAKKYTSTSVCFHGIALKSAEGRSYLSPLLLPELPQLHQAHWSNGNVLHLHFGDAYLISQLGQQLASCFSCLSQAF